MKVKKVLKLTPEQKEAKKPFVREWVRRGLSIVPIDRARAKAVIDKCYMASRLKKTPQTIEFVSSPLALVRRGAEILGKKGDKQTQKNLTGRCCWGQHEAGWLSWYAFFREKCGLTKETEKMVGLIESADALHWWLPFKNICLVSERPIMQKIENRKLHSDTGPAVLYEDGFALYRMWGVRVPKWLAETPAKDLDIKKIMALPNVDQRTVGVRKFGIDKMREYLKAKVSHTFGKYELMTIEVEGRRVGHYLKMEGPTTGDVHVEGVGRLGMIDESIKTCQDAIMFRRTRKPTGAKYTAPLFQA